MTKSDHIIKSLRDDGFRITTVRQAVVDLITYSANPLSSPKLQKILSDKKIKANKTTVYRELEFLLSQNIIKELKFDDGVSYYEITPKDHHHHIVCTHCNNIEHVELPHDLDVHEQKIARKNNFQVTAHTLEFYGICGRCRTASRI
jgi:Fur family transcriptional regulator, ferric uptake regulator